MKKLLVAALAALTFVSCFEKENPDSAGSDYATVTMGGQTWNKAEIMTYSALISSEEITFNLVLDADGKRTTTGHVTYYTNPKSISFLDSTGYYSSMDAGTMTVTKTDDKHYNVNFSGTDEDGNRLVIKGKATILY